MKNSSHMRFEFGTFDERLAHICAVFEIEAPDFPIDNSLSETLTDKNMAWIKEHNINMDWLFAGSPSFLIKHSAKRETDVKKFTDTITQLEPEIVKGLHALMYSVTIHDIPMKEATAVFDAVVKEFRAIKAA